MKIVFLSNTAWSIYNFRMGLIKSLQQVGHEIIAISPTDDYVKDLLNLGVTYFGIKIKSNGTNPIDDIRIIISYKKLFKRIKPDIILSYTIKPNIYGNLAIGSLKIPVINNISGLGTIFIRKSVSSYIGRVLYYFSLRKSSWVFFQNKFDCDLFIESKLINAKKTSIIPGSGVNTSKFRMCRNSNNGKQFLFVGRLIADKGIKEFVMAANRLTEKYYDIVFNIVGELGSANNTAISEEELKGWLRNKQVKYLGKQDNMVKILSNADIMVLPSYREGLSKSLIEAASMNLPIITTNTPGCVEVVEHGENGFLCKVQDSSDLEKKMEEMICLSERERVIMGEKGRDLVLTKYDEKFVIEMYKNKIIEVVFKK